MFSNKTSFTFNVKVNGRVLIVRYLFILNLYVFYVSVCGGGGLGVHTLRQMPMDDPQEPVGGSCELPGMSAQYGTGFPLSAESSL